MRVSIFFIKRKIRYICCSKQKFLEKTYYGSLIKYYGLRYLELLWTHYSVIKTR